MKRIVMRCLILLPMLSAVITGCKKEAVKSVSVLKTTASSPANPGFTRYVIEKGQQYANNTYGVLEMVSTNDLHFKVIFDSTAIYKTDTAYNQFDINKLYGFADNDVMDHHEFSARFGWNWNYGRLWLYAYDYNNGAETNKSLGSIPIGVAADCHIIVKSNLYQFVLNGVTTTMPRASTTATGAGYKLFPYFGGTETAPHTINVDIDEISE